MSFNGLRVLSLESRRAVEIERLILSNAGVPFVAPSMREVALEDNPAAFAFAERLFLGEFEMMIFLTGVGARLLKDTLVTRYAADDFFAALRKIAIVVRGPKPFGVMREWDVPVTVRVPEPNTWREVAAAIEGRPEKRVAVQEYGRASQELVGALQSCGLEITTVPVYQWDLPKDCAPLREAVRRLSENEFDVVMFTTSVQIGHLLRVAREMNLYSAVLKALDRLVIASVGPTTTETLIEHGLRADVEPSHPKMGFLVQETAEKSSEILSGKRADR